MYVRISKLRKVVAEQAMRLFEELSVAEDTDRLRRGAPGEYSGESHTGFEESLEMEAKDEEDAPPKKSKKPVEDDGDESKPEPKAKKKSEKPEPKEKPKSPKHMKAVKGLQKAQKSKNLPKNMINPKTGVKQDVDLDSIAKLATEIVHAMEAKKQEGAVNCPACGQPAHILPDDSGEAMCSKCGPFDLDPTKEDVAIVSSDEDLEDVVDLDHDEDDHEHDELGCDVEDEGMRLDIEGNPLSMKKSLPVVKQGSPKQAGVKLRLR